MPKLNDSQLQAVEQNKGPLLIIAGAGTGKTTVITSKIQYLIEKKKVKPEEILALTFTDKAAGEMVERLDSNLQIGYFGYEDPWIHTFHGFCNRLLKLEALEIGLSPDYELIDKVTQWMFIKKNLFNLNLSYYSPLGNPNKFIDALIKFFSRLQDEDVSEEEIHKFLKSHPSKAEEDKENLVRYKELFRAYDFYNKLKREQNCLDFSDQISWTIKLFRDRPNILAKYQKQFKYMLVDEFQDTNFAQLQLIKLLAPPDKNPNLTVVGDDDQAIYAFRGSSVHNILDFKNHYPQAKEVILSTNYRSSQQILNSSYHSIVKNNPDRLEEVLKIDKKLVAARGKSFPKPQIIEVNSLEDEADFVTNKILELVGDDYSYKDVAILARANSHLNPFVSSLKRSGIPYQLIANRGLYDQDEIRDLIFFARAVVNPKDQNNLFYFLHSSIFDLSSATLLNLINQSRTNSISLWELITDKAKANKDYNKIISHIAKAQDNDTKKSIVEIFYDYISDTNYLKEFTKEDSIENQLSIKNLNLFFEKLKKFDEQNPKSSMADFVYYFEQAIEAGDNPAQAQIEDIDTVNLLTIHSAKGLEWPIVFIVNTVQGRFPSNMRKDKIEIPDDFVKQKLPEGKSNIQEERRLFYVALTRARDHLFLVWGKDYGGKRPKKPSKFLSEISIEPKSWQPNKQKELFAIPKGVKAPKSQFVDNSKIVITSVSYSQVDIYRTCPLRYKYQNIIKIPMKDHHALSFGNTIHNTLQLFHQFEQAGQNPDLDTLLHIYEKKFRPIGYDSIEHKEKRFKDGKKSLKNYYKKWQDQFEGKRLVLEKSFKIPLFNHVFLRGKIDRVDKLPDGSLEVIDYKTGSAAKKEKVDKDKQLTIYAMASQVLFEQIPETLSLYFIDDCSKVSSRRSEKQINKEKEKIIETVHNIQAGKFDPKPGMLCKYCPYNQLCPFAKKD